MRDFATDVTVFNNIAAGESKFDARRFSLYLGLILEEVSETFEPFMSNQEVLHLVNTMKTYSKLCKEGRFVPEIEDMSLNDRIECLDGSIDTAVVGLGAAHALGCDVVAAATHIMDTNLAKYPVVNGSRTVIRDENGKIKKPPGWTEPSLNQFMK